MRGQVNLAALGVALLALTATVGMSIAFADGAFRGATRDAGDERVAVSLAERLTDAESPLTTRENVLDGDAMANLSATDLDESFPVVRDRSVRLVLDGEQVVERGAPAGGTTVERIVLVEHRQSRTYRPPIPAGRTTLPRRTDRIDLGIDPPDEARVTVARANDRVVLQNRNGLEGNFTVAVSPLETVKVRLESTELLRRGNVSVTYYPRETTKATLAVTVDA